MGIALNINNETDHLDMVILGIGEDMGAPITINPKARFHLEQNSYPSQSDILNEINTFYKVLIEHGVKVLRPQNKSKLMQIFARDIGFVINDVFFISSIVKSRKPEIKCIDYIIDLFDKEKIVDCSAYNGVQIEGGDVVLYKNTVFVGLSDRTNQKGYELLKHQLAGKMEVKQVELVVNPNDHLINVLHLDCAFQPLGHNCIIIYEAGIKNLSLLHAALDMPEANIFKVNKCEFLSMFPNVFSISTNTVIIEAEAAIPERVLRRRNRNDFGSEFPPEILILIQQRRAGRAAGSAAAIVIAIGIEQPFQ